MGFLAQRSDGSRPKFIHAFRGRRRGAVRFRCVSWPPGRGGSSSGAETSAAGTSHRMQEPQAAAGTVAAPSVITIDRTSPVPLYLQHARHFEAVIRPGGSRSARGWTTRCNSPSGWACPAPRCGPVAGREGDCNEVMHAVGPSATGPGSRRLGSLLLAAGDLVPCHGPDMRPPRPTAWTFPSHELISSMKLSLMVLYLEMTG